MVLRVGGVSQGTPNSYTFSNVTANQTYYMVDQAQAGVWGMKLNGTLAPTDQYLAAMQGNKPAATLTGMTADSNAPCSRGAFLIFVKEKSGTVHSEATLI
jgi:hypothetical protein